MSKILDFFQLLVYKFSQYLVYFFLIVYHRFTYHGKKNIPGNHPDGVILASNHCSNFDPFIVGMPFHRRIKFFAKKSLSKGFIGWWAKNVGAVFVDRNAVAPSSLKTIINLLKQGNILTYFPEGTRNKGSGLKKFTKGIGMIVKKSNAVVIPTYIKGSNRITPKGKSIPRPVKVTVYYGKPFHYEKFINNNDYEGLADSLREEIQGIKDKVEK